MANVKLCMAARELIANDIEQYLDNLNKLLSGQEQKITLLKSAKTEWKKYRAGESLIHSLFSCSRRFAVSDSTKYNCFSKIN